MCDAFGALSTTDEEKEFPKEESIDIIASMDKIAAMKKGFESDKPEGKKMSPKKGGPLSVVDEKKEGYDESEEAVKVPLEVVTKTPKNESEAEDKTASPQAEHGSKSPKKSKSRDTKSAKSSDSKSEKKSKKKPSNEDEQRQGPSPMRSTKANDASPTKVRNDADLANVEVPVADGKKAVPGGPPPMKAIEAARAALASLENPEALGTEEDFKEPREERDFDNEATPLYLALQKKEWEKALECIKESPEHTKIWISRKEAGGQLRWRLLPIHASIIFIAPHNVVNALLKVFPDGARCADDQGMLPVHLSYRMGSPEKVVSMLLGAFPGAVFVKDRKGRTPQILADTSNGPNKAAFMRALKKGTAAADKKQASVAGQFSATVAEQRAIFETYLVNLENERAAELKLVKNDAVQQKVALSKQVKSLETALAKNQQTSQVLVNHIAELETQLQKRSDTERYLESKMASLDDVRSADLPADEIEKAYRAEFVNLQLKQKELEDKVSELEATKETTTTALREALVEVETKKNEWGEKEAEADATRATLEADCRGLRADIMVLEEQVRVGSETEKSLAGQVSLLASQLQAATESSGSSTTAFTNRIRSLESERETLRFTVQRLSKKLYHVAGLLDNMGKEQNKIVDQALGHEDQSAQIACAQADLLQEVKEQAELVEKARKEKDEVVKFLNDRLEHLEHTEVTKKSVLTAIEEQANQLALTSENRLEFIKGVAELKEQMGDVLDSVYLELPRVVPDDDALVDQVLKIVTGRRSEMEQSVAESSAEVIKPTATADTTPSEAEPIQEDAVSTLKTTPEAAPGAPTPVLP